MAIDTNDTQSKMNDLELGTGDPAVSAGESVNEDPITGEPGAHPTAVGVGALSAGAAGAAIGMLAGPVGAVIGAAIGAVAGGLAGHEVAAASSGDAEPAAGDLNPEATGTLTDDTGRPTSVTPMAEEPLTVFPGSDFGSPTIVAEPAEAATPAAVDSAAETVDERVDLAAAAADAGYIKEGSGFAVGADPTEVVRMAAYYRYLDRLEAGRSGDELGDWVEAEREVTRF